MTRLSLSLILVIVGCAVACQRAEVSPVNMQTREVRDDLGRAVRVPQKIERAISLAPNLTEMIFALGAGDRLVGVTTYCNFPPGAASIEKIGDTQTPNIEKIIALRPQVVFVSTASQLEAFMQTLNEQSIAVYVTNPKTLDEVFENLIDLGDLLGSNRAAEELVASLAERAANVRQHAIAPTVPPDSSAAEPRVFVQISNEPLFTIGRDSFLTELIQQAGGVSVTKDVPSGYPKLSKETAAALDPDVIILSDSPDNQRPSAAFKDSKAVKIGRIHRINADIISRPGPRLVDALEEIKRMLHPGN
ncbi:MAG TPA: cobalamin-binding protein [Pyrinomonadaceae bacterium]